MSSGQLPLTLWTLLGGRLNQNSAGALSQTERDLLVNDLLNGVKTRAEIARTVAEDSDLVKAELNPAFVLIEYFGYLRRNPNEGQDSDHTGYDFWLSKLVQRKLCRRRNGKGVSRFSRIQGAV